MIGGRNSELRYVLQRLISKNDRDGYNNKEKNKLMGFVK